MQWGAHIGLLLAGIGFKVNDSAMPVREFTLLVSIDAAAFTQSRSVLQAH